MTSVPWVGTTVVPRFPNVIYSRRRFKLGNVQKPRCPCIILIITIIMALVDVCQELITRLNSYFHVFQWTRRATPREAHSAPAHRLAARTLQGLSTLAAVTQSRPSLNLSRSLRMLWRDSITRHLPGFTEVLPSFLSSLFFLFHPGKFTFTLPVSVKDLGDGKGGEVSLTSSFHIPIPCSRHPQNNCYFYHMHCFFSSLLHCFFPTYNESLPFPWFFTNSYSTLCVKIQTFTYLK